MAEKNKAPQQEWLFFAVMQALGGLRDGLQPFVLGVLEEKEGPQWFINPRVQRMLSLPPVLDGEDMNQKCHHLTLHCYLS